MCFQESCFVMGVLLQICSIFPNTLLQEHLRRAASVLMQQNLLQFLHIISKCKYPFFSLDLILFEIEYGNPPKPPIGISAIDKFRELTVSSYHVTYGFQSEYALYSCLNVKEFLARNRRDI